MTTTITPHMRLFFAATIPDDIRAALTTTLAREGRFAFRWIASELLHITLKFVGDCPPTLAPVAATFDALAGCKTGPFTAQLGDTLGGFPNLGPRARVIHVPVAMGGEALATLAATLDEQVSMFGIPRETRPFTAHLTLARVKHPPIPGPEINRLTRIRFDPAVTRPFAIDRVVLIESELRPSGPIYRPQRTLLLPGATPR